MPTRLRAALALALCSAPAAAHPQGTRTLTIESRALGEARRVDVTLPNDYAANPGARYPVVVVLDGELEGELAAAVARFHADVGTLPGVIVAAVPNRAGTRTRDPRLDARRVVRFVRVRGPAER